ncbi:hypothetical protein GG681_10335 [Epibacterium sp. SM1969]|uniref:Uncharacterized protein n=1 Tax=Tritonibacter aquimaris TaxID=2663379 RepID=A0A844AUE1_9RHOB|nr:hypothetical protein [Tritonibacter aquimaris]MQY43038.1 hypothetical protein [Tritonibacter aquimaris]
MTIRSLLIALPCLFFGWIAILLVVAVSTDDAPAYVVLFPPKGFVAALPETASILSLSDYSITVSANETGFARALYNRGALVVLPAGLPGCLPVPNSL